MSPAAVRCFCICLLQAAPAGRYTDGYLARVASSAERKSHVQLSFAPLLLLCMRGAESSCLEASPTSSGAACTLPNRQAAAGLCLSPNYWQTHPAANCRRRGAALRHTRKRQPQHSAAWERRGYSFLSVSIGHMRIIGPSAALLPDLTRCVAPSPALLCPLPCTALHRHYHDCFSGVFPQPCAHPFRLAQSPAVRARHIPVLSASWSRSCARSCGMAGGPAATAGGCRPGSWRPSRMINGCRATGY